VKPLYVLDACALLAYLYNESGANFMQDIFDLAKKNKSAVYMHAVNLFEVYYDVCKTHGEDTAKTILKNIKKFPVTINYEINENIISKAGVLKSKYRMSLADSIGLAQTALLNASFITADHHELDAVEANEKIKFTWLR